MKETPPPRKRLRRLTDEEIALWTEVARSVARRRGAALPTPSNPVRPARPPAPPPTAAEPPADRPAKPSTRRRSRRSNGGSSASFHADAPRSTAALDLHGLTQAEAHQALRGFLRHSQTRGARLVIIVTGKGGAIDEFSGWPNERGVLKRLTPQWLREPDLRSVVLGFEEAGRAHGGSGALYVRLRRLQVPSARP